MKQGRRFGFSAEQKLDVWRRWKAGQTLHEIGRAFGKEHSSIRCLAGYGQVPPLLHLPDQRVNQHLVRGCGADSLPTSVRINQ